MSDEVKTKFEAVVLRYASDPRSGELLNLGVALYCPGRKYLDCRMSKSVQRIVGAFPNTDFVILRRTAQAVEEFCSTHAAQLRNELPLLPTGALDSLVGRLLPPMDSGFQVSAPIVGITANPEKLLGELFESYIGRYSKDEAASKGRSDADVWSTFAAKAGVPKMKSFEVRSPLDWTFKHAWKNGTWNAVETVSLDLLDHKKIKVRAAERGGIYRAISPFRVNLKLYVLVGLPTEQSQGARLASQEALKILSHQLEETATVIPENDVVATDQLARKISDDFEMHLKDEDSA